MQESRRQLLVAVALIVGGVLAFFAFLAAMGIDPDKRPLGLLEWVVGGMLIVPGFGYLIRWRQVRDRTKRANGPDPSP